MKSWKDMTHHVFFLWLLPFILAYPNISKAAKVMFSFNPEIVSVTDNKKIYTFPRTVFEAHFGNFQVGDEIEIGEQYKGFESMAQRIEGHLSQKVVDVLQTQQFSYGDMHYQQMGQYWFLARSTAVLGADDQFPLDAESVQYTWIVPEVALLDTNGKKETEEKNATLKEGFWEFTGRVHFDEGLQMTAIQVKDRIYYVNRRISDHSPELGAVESFKIKDSDIIYIAETSSGGIGY